MDLDASPYRAFLEVARHDSFTRAAEALNVSQPALSATIRELERRLGFSLFDRTSRRVALTREGRSFLVNAKRVVMENDWARLRARELLGNALRIAVQPYSSLITARVTLTEGFLTDHPRVEVEFLQIGSERIYDAVTGDDADIGIVFESADREELSPIGHDHGSDLETLPVTRRRTGLLLPPGHALAGGDAVPEAALRGLPVAVTGRVHGAPLASALTRYLEDQGADPVRVPEADFFSMLRFARRQGLAAVDTGWFDPPPQDADFARLPIAGAALETEMILLCRARSLRPAAELFWQHASSAAPR